MPIGVAIIGCGVIAPVHTHAMGMDRRSRLLWAVDADPARAAAFAASHGIADHGTLEQALADPTVDLVCVCTPHHLHTEQVLAALAAGKHVWCEKPLATRPDDLARMIAAVPAKRVCSGVFQHRFAPIARRLRQLIAAGDLGRVRRVDARFRCTRSAEYYASGPWRGRWAGEGGALLINQAIHTIDMGLWLAGAPVARVRGRVVRQRLAGIEAEDAATLEAELADGAVFTLDAANDGVTDWGIRLELATDAGRIVLGPDEAVVEAELDSQALMLELTALGGLRLPKMQLGGKACYGDLHTLQAADVLTAIATGRAPMVGFSEAAIANATVLAAYHSAAADGAWIAPGAADFRRPVLSPSLQGMP